MRREEREEEKRRGGDEEKRRRGDEERRGRTSVKPSAGERPPRDVARLGLRPSRERRRGERREETDPRHAFRIRCSASLSESIESIRSIP
ncbi:MAG: hypothetical protein ACO396_07230, partial [Phycisphaerales bacterium]